MSQQTLPAAGSQRLASDIDSDQLPSIRVRVVRDDIGRIGEPGHVPTGEPLPIDAIAVGHYAGVEPKDAELALDRAISAGSPDDDPGGFIITGLTRRCTIQGDLGVPFIISDPRPGSHGRVIVVASMGAPGGFGEPELIVLARELCWCLSRMSKRHLATVLIGSGNGNLDLANAAEAWLRGLREALADFPPGKNRLEAVTFVEFDPTRASDLHAALRDRKDRVQGLDVIRGPFERLQGKRAVGKRPTPDEPRREHFVNCLNATHSAKAWDFTLFPAKFPAEHGIVKAHQKCNREALAIRLQALANAGQVRHQLIRGGALRPKLLPEKLWRAIYKSAPLTVVCSDSTVAGVPWEMIATPPAKAPGPRPTSPHTSFLGTARGLTRHIQKSPGPTTLARKTPLRMLLVADACREHPLDGMRRGADHLLKMFDRFNGLTRKARDSARIEVTYLIGPDVATRERVLKELYQTEPYDLLYYGGHGEYDEDDPSKSGWIFSRNDRVSAEDMEQVSAIPRFIFSNACETGRFAEEPDRRHGRHARSFAQVLLERGVADFVCAGWPIGNNEAAAFALELFRNLLGVDGVGVPAPMYVAMQEARKKLMEMGPSGAEAWGAYQHYGDPYFQLFS